MNQSLGDKDEADEGPAVIRVRARGKGERVDERRAGKVLPSQPLVEP